mgnify:CR=1 FL=1
MVAHRDERLPPRTRRILHLDVDAFLASVEQALHPELRGRPVVVGGSPTSRNLVMSCSYDARRRGVRPGMFASQAARHCPEAVFVPGDSKAANQKRAEIVRLLLEVSPRIQVTSIDDFLVDLTGSTRLLGCAFTVAERLRARIWTQTHMPVTVGVGTGPILARLAGKLGKPGGVAGILPGHERAFLARLPVRHLPGVGHKTASVVMAQAFGVPAFPVDTHIHRLAARWGLSKGINVEQTEADLKKVFPRDRWNVLHLQIIYFGREYCPARGHDLSTCRICSWAATAKRIREEEKKNKGTAKK